MEHSIDLDYLTVQLQLDSGERVDLNACGDRCMSLTDLIDQPRERQSACFYWRGRVLSGLVCVPCNALWDDPEDSFQALAARLDGEGGE